MMDQNSLESNEELTVTLTPPEVSITERVKTSTISVNISGADSTKEPYRLAIIDLDPAWYTISESESEREISVAPDGTATVQIEVHPVIEQLKAIERVVFDIYVHEGDNPIPAGTIKAAISFVVKQVEVSLEPSEVLLTLKSPLATLTVWVDNLGSADDEYVVTVNGIDPSWYTLTLPIIKIGAGDRVPVPINLHPPEPIFLVGRRYSYAVSASSKKNPTTAEAATGTIEITPTPIDLELSPGVLELAPDNMKERIIVTLRNAGPYVEQFHLQVHGLDESWYSFQTEAIDLFPNDSQQVPIDITLPTGQKQNAGDYAFTVLARAGSTLDANMEREISGVLRIGKSVSFQVNLEPQSATGPEAKYDVQIVNNSNTDITVALEGSDVGDVLSYDFETAQPVVSSGSKLPVLLTVKLRDAGAVPAPAMRQFKVTARLVEPGEFARSESSEQSIAGIFSLPAPVLPAGPGKGRGLLSNRLLWLLGLGVAGAFVLLMFFALRGGGTAGPVPIGPTRTPISPTGTIPDVPTTLPGLTLGTSVATAIDTAQPSVIETVQPTATVTLTQTLTLTSTTVVLTVPSPTVYGYVQSISFDDVYLRNGPSINAAVSFYLVSPGNVFAVIGEPRSDVDNPEDRWLPVRFLCDERTGWIPVVFTNGISSSPPPCPSPVATVTLPPTKTNSSYGYVQAFEDSFTYYLRNGPSMRASAAHRFRWGDVFAVIGEPRSDVDNPEDRWLPVRFLCDERTGWIPVIYTDVIGSSPPPCPSPVATVTLPPTATNRSYINYVSVFIATYLRSGPSIRASESYIANAGDVFVVIGDDSFSDVDYPNDSSLEWVPVRFQCDERTGWITYKNLRQIDSSPPPCPSPTVNR